MLRPHEDSCLEKGLGHFLGQLIAQQQGSYNGKSSQYIKTIYKLGL